MIPILASLGAAFAVVFFIERRRGRTESLCTRARPSIVAHGMDVIFRNPKEGTPMTAGGKVGIDIADGSQSVTKTVKRLLGDNVSISSDDVHLLDNGWVQLRRGDNNLYISPHAIESVLVEDGELT
jgi:hypothetical protein